jgi:hypothetical protein
MKHLKNMNVAFPHVPSRDAIMGIACFDAKAAPSDDEKPKQRRISVRVSCIIRPHLQPCYTTAVSVPPSARMSDVLRIAWEQFNSERERRGFLWGALPSHDLQHFTLCYQSEGTVVGECPSKALVSRIITLPEAAEGFALVLRSVYLESEQLIACEQKTRSAVSDIFLRSWDALRGFELERKEIADANQGQRMLFLEQRQKLEAAQRQERDAADDARCAAVVAMAAAFKSRFQELECGMIAQYTHMANLRQRLRADMERTATGAGTE